MCVDRKEMISRDVGPGHSNVRNMEDGGKTAKRLRQDSLCDGRRTKKEESPGRQVRKVSEKVSL